ncbi:hypothetical protein GCM10010124_33760 [Pilimelia terevasa]|uniref:Plasmid replication, integration and excision activator n=1 Tax=Pilimelia terevasa TaxID=53372 RepID=A0A8J3FJL0_9ACTN|nr:transcriptional regulator [Pilimelia terevasa]GGK38183.1 hypothetical protein GCM10010124_33760 [Pilimelia terevasa]
MALKGGWRFAVRFEDMFPSGCAMSADALVSKVTDFEKKGKADDQDIDKQTNLRVWSVRVIDLDPDLEGRSREVVVKISAPVQPVPPVGAFQPVEFEGLTVTPWVNDKGRQQYSIRATGMRAPRSAGEVRAAEGKPAAKAGA